LKQLFNKTKTLFVLIFLSVNCFLKKLSVSGKSIPTAFGRGNAALREHIYINNYSLKEKINDKV